MIRFLSFLIIWLIGFLSLQVFASEDKSAFRYLKDPQFKWEDERLSGALKNVPVKDLLEELSRKEGFQLDIVGDLNQKVDISFDHLTLEQSIKKIIRLTNLNYIMILDGEGVSEEKGRHRLEKLIVCQKDNRAQSSRAHCTRPVQLSPPPELSTEHRQRPKVGRKTEGRN
jgi:hypothetical protein